MQHRWREGPSEALVSLCRFGFGVGIPLEPLVRTGGQLVTGIILWKRFAFPRVPMHCLIASDIRVRDGALYGAGLSLSSLFSHAVDTTQP